MPINATYTRSKCMRINTSINHVSFNESIPSIDADADADAADCFGCCLFSVVACCLLLGVCVVRYTSDKECCKDETCGWTIQHHQTKHLSKHKRVTTQPHKHHHRHNVTATNTTNNLVRTDACCTVHDMRTYSSE